MMLGQAESYALTNDCVNWHARGRPQPRQTNHVTDQQQAAQLAGPGATLALV